MNEQIKTTDQQVQKIFDQVKANAKRLKELGNWPDWLDEEESLLERIPQPGEANASGFDAGIACTLNLIPLEKQKLAATLHAAYTPEAVEQVRREIKTLTADDETCWWLAGCSVCAEGGIDQAKFLKQIADFKILIQDAEKRLAAAQAEYAKMVKLFYFTPEFGPDVAYGEDDGCMQGAYIAGQKFAVQYAGHYNIYFIGTYLESLGLEEFPWSEEKDESGRSKSGPNHGSKQFVKCANLAELKAALKIVKQKLLNS